MSEGPFPYGTQNFLFPPCSLGEEGQTIRIKMALDVFQQDRKRRQGSRGDDISLRRRDALDAIIADFNVERQTAASGPEKGRLPFIGLDQRDVEIGTRDRQNDPGKSATAAEIRKRSGSFRYVIAKAQAVLDVTSLDRFHIRCGD
jgi:hypothetical protein